MSWRSRVVDVLYLNFGVNEEEVARILPPQTNVDSRLHRGEPWGFFTLVLFKHDTTHHATIPWPRFSYPQANLRVYIKDSDGTPSVYFKRLYIPGIYALLTRLYAKQPVTKMELNYPGRIHQGGEYRWRLSGAGEGNISGKIGKGEGVSGNLVSLFDSPADMVNFIRRRPMAYYSAGMDYVYRLNVRGTYGDYHPFQVHEWELGFLADDLERHNFPEAISGNFCCPEMNFEFDSPEKVDLKNLTRV